MRSPRAAIVPALAPALALFISACGGGSTAATPAATATSQPPVPADSHATPTPPPQQDQAADAVASATFRVAGESFDFSLAMCMVSEEDILVKGPGRNSASGELAYLDVDFTAYEGSYAGGVSVDLGTDQPFTSPDDTYRLDPLFDSAGFGLTIVGESATVEGAFHGYGSASLDGGSSHGVLEVRCDGA